MGILFSVLIFVTLIIAGLAGLVYFHGPKEPANRIFALTSVCVAGWALTNALFQVAPTPGGTMLWANLSYVAAIAIGTSLVHFSWVFPSLEDVSVRGRAAIWAAGIMVSLLPFVPRLVIYGITPSKDLLTHPGVYAIAAYLAVAFLAAFGRFARKFRKARGRDRDRLGLFLLGAALTAAFGVAFNLLLPLAGNYRFVALGPAASLFFVVSTVYAVVAHQLFDIRIVVRRAAVYSALLGFVFAVYVAIFFYLTAVLDRGAQSNVASLAAYMGGALIVGFSLDPLRRWLNEKTDRFLFQKQYEEQRVLRELAAKLSGVLVPDEALGTTMRTLAQVLHLKRAAACVFEPESDGRRAVKWTRPVGQGGAVRLLPREEDEPALHYLAGRPGMTAAADLRREAGADQAKVGHVSRGAGSRGPADRLSRMTRAQADRQAALEAMRSLGADMVIPLRQGVTPLGLIFLGEKLAGTPFSAEDLGLVEAAASQAAGAIEKARYYEGDQTKSEFVSIASHELLTPISAIEGYLSMILDEHMGQQDQQTRDYLTKVYASAKRLSQLVRDLLSVSRIESGRLKVEPRPIDLEELIDRSHD